MRKKILLVSSIFVVLLLGSCATVHMASPELDMKAKTMVAPKDKALLYVYRNESFGGVRAMDVKIDGRLMGQTKGHTYMVFLLSPGKHMIASEAENTSEMDLEVKAGETYYIWQEVKLGILYAPRTKLTLMQNIEGKKGLEECELVEHIPAP